MSTCIPALGSWVKPRKEKAAPSKFPEFPYVGLEHVESVSCRLLGTVPATTMRSNANRFYPGDVLYSRLRPYLNKVWHADRAGLCSSEFIVLPGNDKIDAGWLRYRLNSAEFVRFANSLNTGDRPRVDFDQISAFPIYPPSLADQRRIVEEIETQLTRLDAGVVALKRVQANLKRQRASVLHAACSGQLVPTEAELGKRKKEEGGTPNTAASASPTRAPADSSFVIPPSSFESGADLLARILTERRATWSGRGSYKEPAAPDITGLPALPAGWCWATVDQLADSGSGNTPAKISEYISDKGEIPWFKVGDMNREGNERFMRSAESYLSIEGAKELGLKIFQPETILFPKRGGAIATNKKRKLEAPAATDLNVMGLTAHGDVRSYFWQWFSSVNLGAISDGSNVPQLNNKDILPLTVPIPPLAEQRRIVAEVERQLSVIDGLETLVVTNLARATRLRQAVLHRAFSAA